MWWIIIGAVIALVVLVVLVFMFTDNTDRVKVGLSACYGGECLSNSATLTLLSKETPLGISTIGVVDIGEIGFSFVSSLIIFTRDDDVSLKELSVKKRSSNKPMIMYLRLTLRLILRLTLK